MAEHETPFVLDERRPFHRESVTGRGANVLHLPSARRGRPPQQLAELSQHSHRGLDLSPGKSRNPQGYLCFHFLSIAERESR
jgi:hypothetical protein